MGGYMMIICISQGIIYNEHNSVLIYVEIPESYMRII